MNEQQLDEATLAAGLASTLAETQRQLDELKAEYADLKLLHEATIAHGEAVEDQLAENNDLLQRTQARLEAELDEASRYSRSILPVPRLENPATDWFFEPSTELGGDSFGYHDIDPDHFAIYLIDVCGHGIGAALLSATIINIVRAQAVSSADYLHPRSVLAALNDAFPMEEQNNMFFTIWYGVHDRRTGELRYSSGGHPPAILLRIDPARPGSEVIVSTEFLGTVGNVAIGTLPGMVFRESVATVSNGNRLLVYSDGAFEVFGTGEYMLNPENLVEFVTADVRRGPTEVYQWVRSHNGDGELPDDFSMVEVRF